MTRSWHSLAGLPLLLIHPQLALSQHAIRTPAECRRIDAELSNAVSDSTWRVALVSLYDCPEELGPSLAALWRALPTDPLRQRLLYSVSAHVHDDSLYRQLVSQVLDNQTPASLRFHSLEVLVTIADSNRTILVREVPGVVLADTGVTVGIGSFSHTFVRYGRNPLPPSVRDSILTLLRALSTGDSSALVRRVARRAHEWLVYPTHSR